MKTPLIRGLVIIAYAICIVVACSPFSKLKASSFDLLPPALNNMCIRSSLRITVEFQEAIQIKNLSIAPMLSIDKYYSLENMVVVVLKEHMIPGKEYTITIQVADKRGNSTYAILVFWGYSDNSPPMLINEFTVEGTKKHPDKVEILCLGDGNIGGTVLYNGSPKNWDARIVFPSLNVQKGDFLLVHWKEIKLSYKNNEYTSKKQANGIDTSNTAWDFWVKDATGLPNSTGVLTLASNPHDHIVDAVLYSTKKYNPERKDKGFGKLAYLMRMKEIIQSHAWVIKGSFIVPEDTINPQDSSATRSLCRTQKSFDSNSKKDWHIVPTGKSSFGAQNNNEKYQKK